MICSVNMLLLFLSKIKKEVLLKYLDNSKKNKIWLDEGSEFYNTHFRKWLKNNSIEMYSTHSEGKSLLKDLLEL